MKVTSIIQQPNGWTRFHLSVGAFVVKNCRWREASGRILFPRRYDKDHYAHKVVCAFGAHINRLRGYVEAEWAKQHPVQEEVFA